MQWEDRANQNGYQRVCAVVERDLLHELVLFIAVGVVPGQRTKRLLVLALANEESRGLADEPEEGELDDTRKHLQELHDGHQVSRSRRNRRTVRLEDSHKEDAKPNLH
jgi:hypothetical protein